MPSLSQRVEDLISRSIDSVDTLELLLLLRRSPDRYWAAAAAEQLLGLREGSARRRLDALLSAGLAARGPESGAFMYSPADADVRLAVDELAAAYDEQRINVINHIYSSNLARLRAFSNAFRIKSDE